MLHNDTDWSLYVIDFNFCERIKKNVVHCLVESEDDAIEVIEISSEEESWIDDGLY
jgi:hypothetical protein